MSRPSKFSPEVRERAIRMVMESSAGHGSQWATIRSVAEKLGCTTETLRRWIRQTEVDQGNRAGMTTSDAERVKQLERENRELRKAKDGLIK